MARRFFEIAARNYCTYLLAALNLIHGVQTKTYDWLLWISLGLVALSLILAGVSAASEVNNNADA